MKPLLLALVLAAAPAQAQAPDDGTGVQTAAVPGGLAEPPAFEPPDGATAQQRTREIGERLRCPVCQGLSIADSNADSARTMYTRVEELVWLGYSGEQIEDYFVDRYGEWVRLEPPAEGLHWIIWVMPVFALGVGALVVASRARESMESPPPSPTPRPPVDEDPYRQRILAELDADDRGAP